MKLEMHQNSLFAILLRSQWWISFAIALAITGVARLVLPAEYAAYAFFFALPFLVIGAVAGWRQLRAPSAGRVARTVEKVRAMAWSDFAAALENGYERDGYLVKRLDGAAAEFEVRKDGRRTLVSSKRWKAARTGIEPLRELDAARRAHDAHGGIYVAVGEVSDNARAFAAEKGIRIADGTELARLLRGSL